MIELDDYNYHIPEKLIGKEPASPRDSAKLLVYNTKTDEILYSSFLHIDRFLPKNSLLVFNNTKVVPARLWLKKESGGKIQVFLMMNELLPKDTSIKGIVDREIRLGAKLYFRSGAYLEVSDQQEQFFYFTPSVSMEETWKLLFFEGTTPIPPYIKHSTLNESALRNKYQSILAKQPASVAAPTASLHFTPRLLKKIGNTGVERTELTLHVGAGTFAPIDQLNFETRSLFTEYYNVSNESAVAINSAKRTGKRVIPVGTTALRTIESSTTKQEDGWAVTAQEGKTNIFIFPPYKFKIVDALITNFHVPKSSLMLLVDAMLQHKGAKRNILDLYRIAGEQNFRFYSFGDGMLIL